jgi:flagellar motor switch protein FliN/FliY
MIEPIETFVATWIDEFSRAVEMFSGAQPGISQKRIDEIPASESFLWLKQSFSSSEGAFTTWIGAPEPTWTDLGRADPDNAQATYLEIVNQAQTGAATVASRAVENPISTSAGEVVAESNFDCANYAVFKLEIDNGRVPPIIFAIEFTAPRILDDAADQTGSSEQDIPAIPEPLLNLELPVAISLGRAELPIKAVLNMQPGTAIELNREIGEDLELVVHGTVIARGEITMVRGNYGLRIKQILGAEDRLSLLEL